MGQMPGPDQQRAAFSDDGFWWWDGAGWKPAMSVDRLWRWNGQAWIAANPAPLSRPGMGTGALVGIIAAVAAAVVVIVSVVAFAAFHVGTASGQPLAAASPAASPTASGQANTNAIPCDQLEHTQVHYHAALQILYQGNNVSIPTNVGRSAFCYYWLHMHSGEPGIIHIEAPGDRSFTLGDFFAVWTAWGQRPQPLDATHVSTFTLSADQRLLVYVDAGDGNGAQLFAGDPKTIVLKNREVITLEITPPAVPPPAFVFPPGF